MGNKHRQQFLIFQPSPLRYTLKPSLLVFSGLSPVGWQLSPIAGWSCDQVCSAVGLRCSEAEQHAHNAEVSSSNGMQSIMNSMGQSCDSYSSAHGTATDIPVMYTEGARKGICFTSSLDRTASQYNCARKSPSNDQHESVRLCYCSAMVPETTSTNPTSTSTVNPSGKFQNISVVSKLAINIEIACFAHYRLFTKLPCQATCTSVSTSSLWHPKGL